MAQACYVWRAGFKTRLAADLACQSAFKIDPLSARKFDPLSG
jgi:hypothetical protein